MSLFISTKPSTCCINLHAISVGTKRQSSLASGSRFQYKLSPSREGQRRPTFAVSTSSQPVPPPTPTPPPVPLNSNPSPAGFPGRKGWIAGAVLALLLPFLKNKWGPLFFLKQNFDQKLQTIEDVVEKLEKVADKVDHIVEDVAKDLPDGALKRVANAIEDAAEKVEAAAHLTDTAIDEIQKLEDEVESYVESKSKQTKASDLIEEKST